MRLAVIGAAGRTGREVVSQALAHGHEVTALVHGGPLDISDPDLRIIDGDVLDFQSVSSAVLGRDAIVFAVPYGREGNRSVLVEGIGNVIHAMATYRVGKIVAISAYGTFNRQDPRLALSQRALMRTTQRAVYDDLEAMERRIMASDLSWTIIRPSGLTDGPLTGDYRVSLEGAVLKGAKRVSRADLAALVLKALSGTTYARRAVTIVS